MAQPQKSPGFAENPEYRVRLEPTPRRLRVELDGAFVADTTRGMMMFETGHLPVYYFPLRDVRMDLMSRTGHRSHCPYKGEASYWSVSAGGHTAENAMWSYETPYAELPELEGLGAFYWDRVDRWYEEDEEVFVHPRDPYKRVDVVQSKRRVKVTIGGRTVAETTRAQFLFETGLPTRYYIPMEDVRLELFTLTETNSRCPYKGIARYWSATVDGRVHEDVVWSYPDPVDGCTRIRNLMCFFNENVDSIEVDGKIVDRPRSKWSRAS